MLFSRPAELPGFVVAQQPPDRKVRDEMLVALAEAQHGRVAYGQLRAFGYTREEIRSMVRRCRLIPVVPEVYAVGYVSRTPLSAVWAAHLATGAVASHRPACVAYKILDDPFPLHLTTPGEGGHRSGITVHQAEGLEWEYIDGLPVVSPARALRGIAATEPRAVLLRAVNEAHVQGLYDHEAVLAECGRGRRGSRALKEAIAECSTPVVYRSEFERVFHRLLLEARLPEPLVNAPFLGWELDFLWPDLGIAVEVDGLRFHDAPRAKILDPIKQNALTLAGLRVLRYRWHRVKHQRPAVVGELRRAFS